MGREAEPELKIDKKEPQRYGCGSKQLCPGGVWLSKVGTKARCSLSKHCANCLKFWSSNPLPAEGGGGLSTKVMKAFKPKALAP